MEDTVLNIQNLKVQFFTSRGVVRAVDDVSWQLETGGSLGIVGESGCGKSVSALSILRLVPDPPGKIVSGSIMYKGGSILEMPDSEIRALRGNEISMVFQDPVSSLNPAYTIGNQIKETLRLHQNIKGKNAHEFAVDLLKSVGIPAPEQRIKEYPHQLSGGMNQRVMIAIAIACNPNILIADEPTTALDVTIQAQIMELFKELKQKKNMAIIIISHDLGLVSQLVDNVIVMYAGKIVEKGILKSIFKKPHHPYTRGLINAIPGMTEKTGKSKTKLTEIPGIVPNLIDKVEGCIFYERCAFKMQKCKSGQPELKKVGELHYSNCWLD